MRADLFHEEDGQTDRQADVYDEANSRFSQYFKASQNDTSIKAGRS